MFISSLYTIQNIIVSNLTSIAVSCNAFIRNYGSKCPWTLFVPSKYKSPNHLNSFVVCSEYFFFLNLNTSVALGLVLTELFTQRFDNSEYKSPVLKAVLAFLQAWQLSLIRIPTLSYSYLPLRVELFFPAYFVVSAFRGQTRL